LFSDFSAGGLHWHTSDHYYCSTSSYLPMAAPPLVFEFIGLVLTAILYGPYCVIFVLYWRIKLKRGDRLKGVLLYAINVNFILCTVIFILAIIETQFDITEAVLDIDSLDLALNWITIASDALYITIDSISQSILLYRCWILWRQPLVMVIPCILSLGYLVIAWTCVSLQIQSTVENLPIPDWHMSLPTIFFPISLGVNALVTILIVYRILAVYNDIRRPKSNVQATSLSLHGNGQRDLYYPLISILIESGLITFVAQLAQTVMYKYATVAFPLVGTNIVVMLFGISTTVVFVRVETGVSYDHHTST